MANVYLPKDLLAELLDLPEGCEVRTTAASGPGEDVRITISGLTGDDTDPSGGPLVGLKYSLDEMQVLSLIGVDAGSTTEKVT